MHPPEEEQRLKNMGILEGEICKLFSTAPGTVPPSDLPTRLNEAAQQVEQIVETLDGAVQELSALVQEQKGYGASFIKSASVAS